MRSLTVVVAVVLAALTATNAGNAQLFYAGPQEASPAGSPVKALLVGIPEGTSYIQIENSGGTITAKSIPIVVIDGTSKPDPPSVPPQTPPQDPPTDEPVNPNNPILEDLNGLALSSARGALDVGRPDEAAIMASFLEGLRQSLVSGDLKPTEVYTQQEQVLKIAYQVMGDGSRERWRPWAEAINPHIIALQPRTQQEFVTLYQNLIDGLNRVSDPNAAINPQRILRLVVAVISKDWPAVVAIVAEIIRERAGG